MGGLPILFLGALYVWGAFKLIGMVKPKWGKWLLMLVFALIPTADAIYGRIKLQQMCAAEDGLHVYRVVEGVAGFDDPKSRPDESWVGPGKFQFVEGEELSGKRSRLSVRPDGSFLREEAIKPISEYIYESEHGKDIDHFRRYEQRIRVRATGEVVGRYVDIRYAGGWSERFVNGIYASSGSVGNCGPFIYKTEFVPRVLKSIK